MQYEDVVFMQGEEAEEALEILDSEGEQAVINYLSQWHYPGEHMTSPEPAEGTSDDVTVEKPYRLAYNHSLGYIGLQAKI